MTGQLLRELRQAAGIKQSDLATAADMDKSTLSVIENGRRPLDPDTETKLVGLIDITVAEMTEEFARLRALVDTTAGPAAGSTA